MAGTTNQGVTTMQRRSFATGLLASAALGLALLAAPAPAAAEGETVVLFLKNVTNPFWRSVRIGGEKAAAELGVTLEIAAPTKPDNIEEQTRLVEDWIVRRPDAFAFVPVDYVAMVPSIQRATAAGIPVVVYSNRMSDIDDVSYVGSSDELIGYEVSRALFEALGGEGKVIHIDGVPAAITAQDRKRGFERALAEYPGIELLASQPGNYRRLPAVQVFENLMQAHPQIDGVVSANDDMAVGVVEALEAAGRGGETLVVGVDVIPDAAALIKEGRMFASGDYSGHDQGYLAVKAAVKHLRGEPVPEQIILPVVLAKEDNIDPWLLPPEERPVPDWDAVVAAQGS
jgi:ribose transport system substrate-binding protein